MGAALLGPLGGFPGLRRVARGQVDQHRAVQLDIARAEQLVHGLVVGDADDRQRTRLERVANRWR
jgi:hypothetical protein